MNGSARVEKGKTMSDWAAIAICIILGIGLLCLIAMMAVTVAESIQEMRHRKEEWERERDRREWGHR